MDLDAGHDRNERENETADISVTKVISGSSCYADRRFARLRIGRTAAEAASRNSPARGNSSAASGTGPVRLAVPTKVLVQAICHVWRLLAAPFVRLMPFRLITFASDARTWATACVARVARALHHRLVNRRKAGARRSVPRQVR